MIRSRAIIMLIMAAFAILYATGASTAAFACAMPPMVRAAPIDSDCGDHSNQQDCALACPPMCAAIAPVSSEVETPQSTVQDAFGNRIVSGSAFHHRPELPPPRLGQALA